MGTAATPPEPRDVHIGRKAVEMGLITARQLAEVLLQISQSGVSEPPLLAATLVSRGLLTPAQVGVISDLAKGGPPRRVGKYHIIRELGRGGMGVVYEAHDPALGRRVALKTLLTGFDSPEETRKIDGERFLREARLCANLPKHPHIVGVYEAGAEDEQKFIAMEFIEGRQFSDWRGSAPRKQQIAVLRDVALAVDHAHKHGVIHRDLKPQNILVDAENRPHVTDFGLAKRGASQPTLALTVTGEVMGTPAYMSPEQAEGRKDIDHRSDIWALGIMLYEILAGKVPFAAETPLKLIMKTVNEPVTPPSGAIRGTPLPPIDAAIEAICMKALAKDPAARPQSAKAFADDMTRWLKAGRSGPATVRPKAPSKTPLYLAIGAAAAVALVAAVVFAGSSRSFDADEVVAQGQRLLADGKPSEALIKFGRVLEEEPDNRAAALGKKEAERRMMAAARPAPAPSSDAEAKRREAAAKELAELDAMVASHRKSESFGPARDLLAQAAGRHEGAAWKGEIVVRSDALQKSVQDLFSQVVAEAEAAKRADLSLEVEARRRRVVRWNWPGLAKELDDALEKITPKPPPLPPPPPRPAEGMVPVLVEQAPFSGSGNAVHSIGISPDGKTFVTSSFEGAVRLWNAATRQPVVLHDGQKCTSVAMSPDGKWYAAGYWDGKVRTWDAATLKLRTLTGGHSTQLLGLLFTPDSKHLLSASTDGSARLWDVATGASQAVLEGHPKGAMCAAIDPAGKFAAIGSATHFIRLWELPSGRDLRTLPIADPCIKVAFLPDGKTLLSAVKNDVVQWDLATGIPRVVGSHTQPVRGLAVSPDGRWIASTSEVDGLKIWEAASAALIETITHGNSFYAVAFSPRGDLLAAGCGNFNLRVWEITGFRPKPK